MPVNNRIAILPYGPSDSATALVNLLRERGHSATKLRTEGSTFRGRRNDLVVNWGNGTIGEEVWNRVVHESYFVNHPTDLVKASNKLKALLTMEAAGVPLVEYTNQKDVAEVWLEEGSLVYARTKLQGHSGEGIVGVHKTPANIQAAGAAFPITNVLPNAPLYTKGITAQRREFRFHVFNGVVVYVQQKKRTNNYQENPNYSNVVRNYHTGWIYATNEVRPNGASLEAAKKAVESLNLTFGAVDIITRGEDAWVLEVNTAPGLQGTTLEVYADAVENFFNGVPQISYDQRAQALPPVVDEEEEAPAPLVAAMAQANHNHGVIEDPIGAAPVQEAPDPLRRPVQPRGNEIHRPQDGKFYFATVGEQRVVVQYNQGMDSFFMTGWDVALARNEVTDLRIALEG